MTSSKAKRYPIYCYVVVEVRNHYPRHGGHYPRTRVVVVRTGVTTKGCLPLKVKRGSGDGGGSFRRKGRGQRRSSTPPLQQRPPTLLLPPMVGGVQDITEAAPVQKSSHLEHANPKGPVLPSAPSPGHLFYDSEDRSDLQFLVGREAWRFPAHSFVVGRLRNTLAALFDHAHGGHAPAEGPIALRLPDVEPDVFKQMLRFIYTDQTSFSSVESTLQLLRASQTFCLPRLTERCLRHLSASVDAASALLVLSHLVAPPPAAGKQRPLSEEETNDPFPVPTDGSVTQTPSGGSATQLPSGAYPTQMPTQLSSGTSPTQLPSGTYPAQLPSGEYPTQLPAQLSLGTFPTQLPSGTYPTQLPSGSAPIPLPFGTYPTQFPFGTNPTPLHGTYPTPLHGTYPDQLPHPAQPSSGTSAAQRSVPRAAMARSVSESGCGLRQRATGSSDVRISNPGGCACSQNCCADDNFCCWIDNVRNELKLRCFQLVDSNADLVLASEAFETLEHPLMADILRRDSLAVSAEPRVFDAAMRWACCACKRARRKLTPENKRAVLGEALLLVRYLTMSPEDFLRGPVAQGVLPGEDKELLLSRLTNRSSGPLPQRWRDARVGVARRRPAPDLAPTDSLSLAEVVQQQPAVVAKSKKKSMSKKLLNGMGDLVICVIQLLD